MFGHLSETELSNLGKPKNSISALKNPISSAFQTLFQSETIPQKIQKQLQNYIKHYCIYCMKKIRRTINSPKKHYLVCMNLNFPMTDLSVLLCKMCPNYYLINERKKLQQHLQKTHSIICNGSMKMSDHAIERTIFTRNYSCKYHKNCSFIASNAMSLMNLFESFFHLSGTTLHPYAWIANSKAAWN